VRCPSCKNRVLQRAGTKVRLRVQGPVVFDADGRCTSRCYWCKAEVDLPLRIAEGAKISGESFIVPKRRG